MYFFSEQLDEASTVAADSIADHARLCAVKLGDEQLLAKLSTGDLVTQEAKYHTRCLVTLYIKANYSQTGSDRKILIISKSLTMELHEQNLFCT